MVFRKSFVQDFPPDPEGFFLFEQILNVLQILIFQLIPDRHLSCVHITRRRRIDIANNTGGPYFFQ